MGNPTSVDDLYPRQWVMAADLNGRGAVVKIVRVDVETFHVPAINEKKTAAVLTFENARRRLILNKTQCRALAEITGSGQFADWVGTRVRLSPGVAPNKKPTIVITAAPASNEPQPPAAGGHEQTGGLRQKPAHWYQDETERQALDLVVEGLGFAAQQVAEALGVEKPELFPGTLQEAIDALSAYADELAAAAGTEDGE